MSSTVTVNGKEISLEKNTLLTTLLEEMSLDKSTVLVERNGNPIPRDQIDSTQVESGDVFELVRFMGGG